MYEKINTKDVIKQKWDNSSKNYDQCPGHGILSEQEKEAWKSLLTQAVGNEQLDVLDVGCGTGVISLLLSEMGHNVVGIDLSEGMLEKAKEKADGLDRPIDFRIGDAEDPPFENESFNIVINRHLLWTLPNPKKAINEWKRVLKPKGKVIIIDGNWGDYNRLYRKIWRYFVSMPLILITEQRNPGHGHYSKDIEKQLPMRHNKRPQADIEILESIGFDVNMIKMTIPRTRSFISTLKYGNWGDQGYFLVKGIK